jgi:endonuclease/exonuclease/phosphatase (EEP) superfamily protein YafD
VRSEFDAGSARRVRAAGRALLGAVWLVALGFVALVVARVVAYDDTTLLALLNAQTVWVFLPAYAIASAAWCFRRYTLAALTTVVVGFHAWSVIGSVGDAQSVSAAARAAPRLRLVSANVYNENAEPERLARELLATRADVLLLQEITPRWRDVLHDIGIADRYPYSEVHARRDTGGQAVFSRVPLLDVRVVDARTRPTISAAVDVDGARVHVVDVHVIGPSYGMSDHRASFASLEALASSLPEPRVVAGDFNATPYNRSLRGFEELGLDSAHERRGRGLAATWPNGEHAPPPVRLDHVFVDDEIVVLAVRELDGVGSDHRPVLVELAIM